MSTHYLSREINDRDVLHVDYDPDTDTVSQIRIVREPYPMDTYFPPQTETIAWYRGDVAQTMYELFQDVVLCPSGTAELSSDVDDDQQVPQESTVPAIEPFCEPCEA